MRKLSARKDAGSNPWGYRSSHLGKAHTIEIKHDMHPE